MEIGKAASGEDIERLLRDGQSLSPSVFVVVDIEMADHDSERALARVHSLSGGRYELCIDARRVRKAEYNTPTFAIVPRRDLATVEANGHPGCLDSRCDYF